MDIPELSDALCQKQTKVVQCFLDGVEKALTSYRWDVDIVGPAYISPSFAEIVASHHGYPFTLTFSNSGTTIHARGRTVPEIDLSARSVKNLTTKVIKTLGDGPHLSTEAAKLFAQWREARIVADQNPKNRRRIVELGAAAAKAVAHLKHNRLEALKSAVTRFAQAPSRETEQALVDEVNALLPR